MIYIKTKLGLEAFKEHNVVLNQKHRYLFIMFDGKKDCSEILKSVADVGIKEEDIKHLLSFGFISSTGVSSPLPVEEVIQELLPEAKEQPVLTEQEKYMKAYHIATRITAGLGLRGFLLNLAVETASDITKLKKLAPKIKDAVGEEKYMELEKALYHGSY